MKIKEHDGRHAVDQEFVFQIHKRRAVDQEFVHCPDDRIRAHQAVDQELAVAQAQLAPTAATEPTAGPRATPNWDPV